jgi:hypothetical protein
MHIRITLNGKEVECGEDGEIKVDEDGRIILAKSPATDEKWEKIWERGWPKYKGEEIICVGRGEILLDINNDPITSKDD